MKYYLIAGEASGDLYGGKLIHALQHSDPQSSFNYWGGQHMQNAAEGCRQSIEETSFMGFLEVAKNIFKIKRLFDFAKQDILEFEPDILILIDYPGFNLRMARWAAKNNVRVAYYISPQLWAWKEQRHVILRDSVDLFFVILPFEVEFYKNLDTPCIYYGHPLVELIPGKQASLPRDNQLIGLFPGSRIQEIKKHLPILIAFAERHKEKNFIISAVEHIDKKYYLQHLTHYHKHIDIQYGNPYQIMEKIGFAIASSGTATLELALHEVPQIVIYKTSAISFAIGKAIVNTEYIALVNLIARRKLVPELLQDQLNPDNLTKVFLELDGESIAQMKAGYKNIRAQLGDGQVSTKTAQHIIDFLAEKTKN